MTTIARINTIRITVYVDHLPAHFHIVGPEGEVMVDLESMTVMAGTLPKSYGAALAWAKANREMIVAEWSRLNGR